MELTWTCHACGEVRPDRAISVHKVDISEGYKLPARSMTMNFLYCNDRSACHEKALSARSLQDMRVRTRKPFMQQEWYLKEMRKWHYVNLFGACCVGFVVLLGFILIFVKLIWKAS